MLPLGSMFLNHNISLHCFANDLKMFLCLKAGADSFNVLLNCVMDVKQWKALHFLKLNEDKIEILFFGNFVSPNVSDIYLSPLSP